MKYLPYYLLALLVILIDQGSKLWVHFNIPMGDAGEIKVLGNWFKIHYIENPGMAFGLELDFVYGKLFLTLFRLLATIGIAFYLKYIIDQNYPRWTSGALALILAGAAGNVIDSTFYGWALGNAPADAPTVWFHGKVVDMIYVDIWKGYLPSWIPLIGDQYYAFWPIFNIADSSIFVGVFVILFAFLFTDVSQALPNGKSSTENNTAASEAADIPN
ncbi:lipoprotein signal peptidase [Eisenibacter elegans]|jgi:signal peptidase II|uniref:lipoprotein signal peptidase n=1 Tax=Eisenibacter elegans TaxID=997 RepID=UPI000404D784|nr:lipoprotein signal peptidase [Eisenibacter elegans]